MKLRFKGEEAPTIYNQLVEDLKDSYDEVDIMLFHPEDRFFITITGQKFYLRNGSTAGFAISLVLSSDEILLQLRTMAGGAGLLDLSWGALSDLENSLYNLIESYGFKAVD